MNKQGRYLHVSQAIGMEGGREQNEKWLWSPIQPHLHPSQKSSGDDSFFCKPGDPDVEYMRKFDFDIVILWIKWVLLIS